MQSFKEVRGQTAIIVNVGDLRRQTFWQPLVSMTTIHISREWLPTPGQQLQINNSLLRRTLRQNPEKHNVMVASWTERNIIIDTSPDHQKIWNKKLQDKKNLLTILIVLPMKGPKVLQRMPDHAPPGITSWLKMTKRSLTQSFSTLSLCWGGFSPTTTKIRLIHFKNDKLEAF